MLGHASATMTLDTYGRLFEDRLSTRSVTRWTAPAQPPESAARARTRCPVLPEPNLERNAEEGLPSVSAGQDPFSHAYPRRDSNPRYRLERPIEG